MYILVNLVWRAFYLGMAIFNYSFINLHTTQPFQISKGLLCALICS